MNEKIRELLTQAISDVDYIHFDKDIDEELAQMYIPDCFTERFAELIVRECAEYITEYFPHSRYEARQMKKHLGVEE